jgi:hypothetical protein
MAARTLKILLMKPNMVSWLEYLDDLNLSNIVRKKVSFFVLNAENELGNKLQ